MYKLNVVLDDKNAKLPEYAHVDDAGMDLFSIEDQMIEPGKSALIDTGIIIELPELTEAQIRPRSGLALKHSITLLNTPGTIDEGYRGRIKVIMINHGKQAFKVTAGMKIAQMVIKPVYRVIVNQVESVTNTKRSTGGFGSTGM